MQRLTPRERKLYDCLVRNDNHVWTVEQLAEVVWEKENLARPAAWRHSLVASMATLRTKTYMLGSNRVVKVSGSRGRGNTGKYTLARTAMRHNMRVYE